MAHSLPDPHHSLDVSILVTLPESYPSTPPQLQLLSKYIGDFGVDTQLFAAVLKTFISSDGVAWNPGDICVFDGIESVLLRCGDWHERHQIIHADRKESAKVEENKQAEVTALTSDVSCPRLRNTPPVNREDSLSPPLDVQLYEAEPIVDRKSTFIGRACRISHPEQVPTILARLQQDRHIAKAAHPVINAWRCTVNGIGYQDNDDDGESAAAGRLAHLLQILELDNVLVVVTRYFGGVHLGPDRFKHINQAARNALDKGGFLGGAETVRKPRGRKNR